MCPEGRRTMPREEKEKLAWNFKGFICLLKHENGIKERNIPVAWLLFFILHKRHSLLRCSRVSTRKVSALFVPLAKFRELFSRSRTSPPFPFYFLINEKFLSKLFIAFVFNNKKKHCECAKIPSKRREKRKEKRRRDYRRDGRKEGKKRNTMSSPEEEKHKHLAKGGGRATKRCSNRLATESQNLGDLAADGRDFCCWFLGC